MPVLCYSSPNELIYHLTSIYPQLTRDIAVPGVGAVGGEDPEQKGNSILVTSAET